METWEKALELEHFIRDFVPAGFTSSLATLMFIPFISNQDIFDLQNGIVPEKLSKPPITWAIRAYMLKGKDNGTQT